MNRFVSHAARAAALALCLGGASACGGEGGGGKPAESAGNPSGAGRSDDSEEATGGASSKDEDTPAPAKGGAGKVAAAPTAAPGEEPPPSSGTPYDKDAVEVELKRAARQVKHNCGSATDDDGSATGPWGKTTASITLGRNGHVKQVTVPAPYDGKAVGLCAVHAFQKIQFPPYAGSTDVAVDREIEFVKPKH